MDEMYENCTDNMEHYQYDPNLLQCESCLQKDELIDTMTQELKSCQRGVVRFRTERNAYIELASKNFTERCKFKEESLRYMKLYNITQQTVQQLCKKDYEQGTYLLLLMEMCEEYEEQRAKLTKELDEVKKMFEKSTSDSSAKDRKCQQLEILSQNQEKLIKTYKNWEQSMKKKLREVRKTARLQVKKALKKTTKVKNGHMLIIANAIKAIEKEILKTIEESAESSDLDEEATSNSHLSLKNSDHSEDDIGDLESVCDSIEEHMPPVQGNRLLQSPNIQINNANASYNIVTHLHSTADNSNVENNDHFNDISDLNVSDYPENSLEKGEGVPLEINKDSILKITHCSENYGCHAVLTSPDDIEAIIPEREATSNSFSDKHIEQGSENQSLCWTYMRLGEDISGNMPEHVSDNNLSEEEVYSMIHKQKSECLVFSRPAVTPIIPSIPTTWKTENRATSSNCTYGIDETVKNDENCIVSHIHLSKTHLKVNEYIRNNLKGKCEIQFSEKLLKKRFRFEDVPIVNDLVENAKLISPYDVAAIPVLSSVGEEIGHDAPNLILSAVDQEGCNKNVSPNCVKSSHIQNHNEALFGTVHFEEFLQNDAGPGCDGYSCDKDELTSSNYGKYQETKIKCSTVWKIPTLTDEITFYPEV